MIPAHTLRAVIRGNISLSILCLYPSPVDTVLALSDLLSLACSARSAWLLGVSLGVGVSRQVQWTHCSFSRRLLSRQLVTLLDDHELGLGVVQPCAFTISSRAY